MTIPANVVVSTIPLGVLKHSSIDFEPALPTRKIGAIERIGMRILNKVALVYNEPFWDTTRDILDVPHGRFSQWFNCTKPSGMPTLLVLMEGDAALQAEEEKTNL